VEVCWAEDRPGGVADCELFAVEGSDPRARVVFTALRPVTDFKLLSLSFESMTDDGVITFGIEELYTLDRLTPERPLAADMTFFGTIPNNGVSYVDETGTLRRFAVDMSGQDGSVYLWEF